MKVVKTAALKAALMVDLTVASMLVIFGVWRVVMMCWTTCAL